MPKEERQDIRYQRSAPKPAQSTKQNSANNVDTKKTSNTANISRPANTSYESQPIDHSNQPAASSDSAQYDWHNNDYPHYDAAADASNFADVYADVNVSSDGYSDTYAEGYDDAYANFDYDANQANNSHNPSSAPNQEGNLYDLLEQIDQFYQQSLHSHPHAKRYFLSRGLTEETIRTFALGYAPAGWQHLEAQFPQDIAGLKALGLVRSSDSGRDYDLLRDRVIFPIRDTQGRTIGFAGRALADDVKPKYINSSDSPVFHKQHVLYGYYESRQQRNNDWMMVEGYMDVIALYQAGIYGAVASMGTATNDAQISRLLTLNPTLTLCFDGDAAGQKAAWRTLEVSLPILSDDKELRFLTLPDAHDPDTYIKAHGTDAMRAQITQALPLSQYVFASLSERYDLSLAEGKAKLMSQVRALTSQLPKGSSFRYLLNNDIYQKLGGRRSQSRAAHDALVDFDSSTLTVNLNTYLCLLYQPKILEQNPLSQIWQRSQVASLTIPESLADRIESSGHQVPKLPSWVDLGDDQLLELVTIIERLLPYLPDDTNAASHFILTNLSSPFQQLLAKHWDGFYQNMVRRGVLDVESLFIELMTRVLYQALKSQHKQADNLLLREVLKRRWQTLLNWQKQREAEQVAKMDG